MSGFGNDDFGDGDFGDWPWAEYTLVELLPEVYKTQDQAIDGQLTNMQESLVDTFEYIRHKTQDLGDLRDPLRAPIDTDFSDPVIVLQVDNLGDGTSRVFLSQGSDESAFVGIRPGMVLTDSSGTEFSILDVESSGQASEFTTTPIDPFTDSNTGRNITVRNTSLANLEVIPLVSGTLISNEATTTSPTNDGTHVGPYTFTVGFAPLAKNLVTVSWTESSVVKTGYFTNTGSFFGQLLPGSSINFATGVITIYPANRVAADVNSIVVTYTTQYILNEFAFPVPFDNGSNVGPYVFTVGFPPLAAAKVTLTWAKSSIAKVGHFSSGGVASGDLNVSSTIDFTTGVISAEPSLGGPIDDSSLFVSYLSAIVLPPTDAIINGQHILAFLANDYGIQLDRKDTAEALQRSYVYNAYQLWDLKGSAMGYGVMGQFGGYLVEPSALYKIASSFATTLDADHVFDFEGDVISNENPGTDLTNWISPPENGSALGPFTIQLDNLPYILDDITLVWTEDGAFSTAFNLNGAVSGTNASHLSAFTVNDTLGQLTVTFNAGHPPDFDSIRVTYNMIDFYTDLAPKTLIMDDVILDVVPLDTYCFDSDYPEQSQTVSATNVTVIGPDGPNTRCRVVVTTAASYESFGTEGVFTDNHSHAFPVENFQLLSNTSYQFETSTTLTPVTGSGTVVWKVLEFPPSGTGPFTIIGIGTDLVEIGQQYSAYSGIRYKLTKNFGGAGPIFVGNVGNWRIIDSAGVQSWIERVAPNPAGSETTYDIEFISPSVPASGDAFIFYSCEQVSSCIYCAASVIRLVLQPDNIYRSAFDTDIVDAANRLVVNLEQMIPAHVRIAEAILDLRPDIMEDPIELTI